MSPPPQPSRVFVSYDSSDVALRHPVLALANRLRSDGVNAWVDLYEPCPAEGWALWRERNLLAADFVVIVCTPGYRRCFDAPAESRGSQVGWEAQLVRQRLHDDPSFRGRILPVVLRDDEPDARPELLRGSPYHALPRGYDELYRHVTGQPAIVGPPLGSLGHRIDNLGPRSAVFEGREAELEATREALRCAAKLATYTVIAGPGGIGKTRLAREHAHLGEADYDLCWWVRASDPASLQADLVRLGVELGILDPAEHAEDSAREVLAWLSTHQRWLVVYDDAEGPAALRGLLPSPCRGHLLITSRSQAWRSIARVVELPRLSPVAAVAVLTRRGGRADDGYADAVAEQLEHLPLALVSAGAYVEATRCSFREYLDALVQDGPSLLGDRKSVPDGRQQSLVRTWELSLAEIRSHAPAAGALLEWLAFLDPGGVPLALLRQHAQLMPPSLRACVGSRLALDDAIAMLIAFGLVARDQGVLRVHRLLPPMIRDTLATRDRQRLAAAVVRWLSEGFTYAPNDTLIQEVPAGLPEQIMAASALTACMRADRERMARLLLDVGDLQSMRGASHAAHTAYLRALTLHEALASARPECPRARRDLSIVCSRLGTLELRAGTLALAHRSFTRALELRRCLACEDPRAPQARRDLASSLAKLGELELRQGDPAAAVERLVQAVELREALADPPGGELAAQRELARAMRMLGRALMRLGELDDATRTLREAIAILDPLVSSQPSGPSARRGMAFALSDLGDALELAGARDEARELYRRALELAEGLAAEDPGNARAQRDLSIDLLRWGAAELHAGHLPEARRAMEQALAVRQRLAEADPLGAEAQQDLARSRIRLEALARLESQAEGRNLALASDHAAAVEATMPGWWELTLVEREAPRRRSVRPNDEARSRYFEALEEADQLRELATRTWRSGNLETARSSLRLLTAITNVLALADPRRRQALARAAAALHDLGSVEHELAALEPARAHLGRAVQHFTARLHMDPTDAATRRDLARCLGRLGQVELDRGDPGRAREPILRCRRMFEDSLVDEPRDAKLLREFGRTLVGIGTAYARRGDLEAARELLQRNLDLAYAVAELEPGRMPARVGILRALRCLAEVEIRRENYPEARELFRLMLEDQDVLAHADPEDACAALDLVLMNAERCSPAA